MEQAIKEYVAYKIDGKTERQLVSDAQNLLSSEPPPSWAKALAFLSPSEILDAYSILDDELTKLGVLPDSNDLRLAVRCELEREADKISKLGEENEDLKNLKRITQLLKLLPTYEFNNLTIPIVEYPYPPSGIVGTTKLAKYLMNNLELLVPNE